MAKLTQSVKWIHCEIVKYKSFALLYNVLLPIETFGRCLVLVHVLWPFGFGNIFGIHSIYEILYFLRIFQLCVQLFNWFDFLSIWLALGVVYRNRNSIKSNIYWEKKEKKKNGIKMQSFLVICHSKHFIRFAFRFIGQ